MASFLFQRIQQQLLHPVPRMASRVVAVMVIGLLLGSSIGTHAVDTLPSKSRGYVSDFTNELSGSDSLERTLATFHEEHGQEVVVALLPSLPAGMSLDQAARQLYEDWNIGSPVRDDGVLILAVLDLQQVRIEVGYGLQDALPDEVVLTLLQSTIAPAFANEDYDGGVQAVVLALLSTLEREAPPLSASVASGRLGVWTVVLLGAAFVVVVFFFWRRSRLRLLRTRGRSGYASSMHRRVVNDL